MSARPKAASRPAPRSRPSRHTVHLIGGPLDGVTFTRRTRPDRVEAPCPCVERQHVEVPEDFAAKLIGGDRGERHMWLAENAGSERYRYVGVAGY